MKFRALLTFSLGAVALVFISTAPRPPHAYSVAAQEAERSQQEEKTMTLPKGKGVGIAVGESRGDDGPGRIGAVSELDVEGLKKLLQTGQDQHRPLLINFWATWCEPCRDEFPDLIQINSDYHPRGLLFVTVSLDDVTDIKTTVPQFLIEMKSPMPAFLLNAPEPEDAIAAVDKTWGGALPATFLFDAQGQVSFKQMGRIKPVELRAALEKVLSEK
jgi:thiol-disulfide isomerase/thioredoxin